MNILNIEPEDYSVRAKRMLAEAGSYIEAEPIDEEELLALLGDVSILITRLKFKIGSKTLDAGRKLRAIATATTGLDHIDLQACEARGIRVLSLRGELEFLRSIPATAELTWGLLLSLSRKLPWAFASTTRGEWARDLFKGRDLAKKTLGIVGLGRIGERIAGYARAFDMKVQAYDPLRNGWVDGVKRFEDLDAFLQSSEILSLHVPLNPETEGLVGSRQIFQLPRGALLINTSRGKIVDEQAVLAALESDHLGGAALDVLSDELAENRHSFQKLRSYADKHQNLILTPHLGGASIDSMMATEDFIAEKIRAFILA